MIGDIFGIVITTHIDIKHVNNSCHNINNANAYLYLVIHTTTTTTTTTTNDDNNTNHNNNLPFLLGPPGGSKATLRPTRGARMGLWKGFVWVMERVCLEFWW